jgi:hypothetical protein
VRGPWHVSKTGNEVPIVHKHTVLNRPSLHCYWSSQPRREEWRPPRPPWPTYWVLPIQKMSGSRGSPCTTVMMEFVTEVFLLLIWWNLLRRYYCY